MPTRRPEYVTATDAAGAYTFAGLPAPGTYELAFVAEGYQPTSLTERVLGGQSRFALDVHARRGHRADLRDRDRRVGARRRASR